MLRIEQSLYPSNAAAPITPREKMTLRPRVPVTQISDGPYTGLILDCTKLGYEPALLPKIIGEDGAEVWGSQKVNRLQVMEKGAVSVASGMRDALALKRIGETPLILKPLGTAGLLHGDVVISADDAKLLMEQNAKSHFLEPLNIVIVID